MTTGAYFNAGPSLSSISIPSVEPVRHHRHFAGKQGARPGSSSIRGIAASIGLFTIGWRSDAPGCSLAQPDYASAPASGYVIFRIPTP